MSGWSAADGTSDGLVPDGVPGGDGYGDGYGDGGGGGLDRLADTDDEKERERILALAAIEVLRSACAEGTASGGPACVELGRRAALGLPDGHGDRTADPDLIQAADYFDQACSLGDGDGCYHVGSCHLYGEGAPKDYEAAVRLFERGCVLGHGGACNNYGAMIKRGLGVKVRVCLFCLAELRVGGLKALSQYPSA